MSAALETIAARLIPPANMPAFMARLAQLRASYLDLTHSIATEAERKVARKKLDREVETLRGTVAILEADGSAHDLGMAAKLNFKITCRLSARHEFYSRSELIDWFVEDILQAIAAAREVRLSALRIGQRPYEMARASLDTEIVVAALQLFGVAETEGRTFERVREVLRQARADAECEDGDPFHGEGLTMSTVDPGEFSN